MKQQKFKPEIKALLLQALRDGSYKQGFGFMRVGDCFCIDGVIADLYAKAHGLQWEEMESAMMYIPYITNMTFILDHKVWEWALIRQIDAWSGVVQGVIEPKFDVGGRELLLMYINDVGKLSFPLIADIIEEQG